MSVSSHELWVDAAPALVADTPFRRFVSGFCENKVALGGFLVFLAIFFAAGFRAGDLAPEPL